MYAVIGFDFSGWLKEEQYEIEFGDFLFQVTREKLEDVEDQKYPRPISNQIAIKISKDSELEAHESALHFLSELSWLYGVGIYATEHGGGSHPLKYLTQFAGHRSGHTSVDLDMYKPLPCSGDQRLALGLYKEGISNNSVFFRFFSLFNVLDISMTGKEREVWLEQYLLENWQGFSFEKATEYVPNKPEELQKFLWEYGRCSIAHMRKEPRMDVHKFSDRRVTNLCYRVIKNAVEHHMQHDLGIPKLLYY